MILCRFQLLFKWKHRKQQKTLKLSNVECDSGSDILYIFCFGQPWQWPCSLSRWSHCEGSFRPSKSIHTVKVSPFTHSIVRISVSVPYSSLHLAPMSLRQTHNFGKQMPSSLSSTPLPCLCMKSSGESKILFQFLRLSNSEQLNNDDRRCLRRPFLCIIDYVFWLPKNVPKYINYIHSKLERAYGHHISMKLMMNDHKTPIHLCAEVSNWFPSIKIYIRVIRWSLRNNDRLSEMKSIKTMSR